MTAEIAILNRSALALAADSAVTTTVGETRKVYDTAEKLFEFCRNQPIALMIYNNVEFVGVPLDVLIRKYRAKRANGSPYKTIKEAADSFLAFLGSFKHDVDEEEKHLKVIVFYILKGLEKRFGSEIGRRLRQFIEGGGKGEVPSREKVLAELIAAEAARLGAAPLKGYLPKITLASFRQRFGKGVIQTLPDVFKGLDITDDLRDALIEMAFRAMKSRRESPMLTGLVFGGFAESDMFPTLRSVEIDGVFFGQVKILSTDEIDIDRKKKRAEVVPFAQKEMVERFMFGFDTQLEGNVQKFVSTAVDQILDAVEEDDEDENLKQKFKELINRNFSQMLENFKARSRKELLDIVYFMSKKEIADIAYALVEVTSHKRRFTTDEASVDGPIDVAVLTKSEGLVWIKRKHYFDQDRNQGFFSAHLWCEGRR